MGQSNIKRKTKETEIRLSLNLYGKGESIIETDCGFLNHMLTLLSAHSRMDLQVYCKGDSQVDYHHTVEDIAITLGQALQEALGDKRGIYRYGNCTLPMDEALIQVCLDFSGRGMLVENIQLSSPRVGDFDTELCKEFMVALSRTGGITLHINQLRGENTHHIIEGIFKALGRALRQAVALDPECIGEIPSTKGVL